MSSRFFALVVASVAIVATVPVTGQSYITESTCMDNAPAVFHPCAQEAAKTFMPPRTADGQPDLGGFWRTRIDGGWHEDVEAHPRTPDDSGGPTMVVDTPDGKVPMQPWADVRRRENAQRYLQQEAGCMLSGVPAGMYMTSLYQILQTRDYLVIQSEEHHAYRIIPLGERPPVGEDMRLWQGDSRGHWEGNTLVIETTNQTARGFLDQRGRFLTDEARVVERVTLVDANTIHYAALIEDENVFTRPWTLVTVFRRNAEAWVDFWEEACHENNKELMEIFLTNYEVYPGISGRQARQLRETWEAQ
jgi:hypothetical protein